MARLGFAIAGAVIGAFFGPVGAQIGFALGGLVGSMLFPGKLPSGPRLNDLIVSTATNGAPIPFGYGSQRISGNVIWAPPIIEKTTTTSVKGGPKQTNYSYTANFAVGFCEGPATIGRIWFDSKVVYDSRATRQNPGQTPPIFAFSAPITASSAVGNQIQATSTLNPPVGTEVIIKNAAVGTGNGTFQVIASSPTQFSYFNPKGIAPGASGTASLPPIKYPAPTIYPGDETQGADPTIQAAVGAANCPAFRGIVVAVWVAFPLGDFGNRIPNVRAEVSFLTSFVKTGGASAVLDASVSNLGTGNGTTATASTSIQPSGSGELAILCTTTMKTSGASNGAPVAPSDGTWNTLFGSFAFWKKQSSAALLSESQGIAGMAGGTGPGYWLSQVTLFGLSGTPGFPAGSSAGNIQNPGPGLSRTIGGPFTPPAGSTIFACFNIQQSALGFGTHANALTITDTAGNAWVNISQLSNNGSGGGDFCQLVTAYAVNVPGVLTQLSIKQSAGDNVPAGFNAISGFIQPITGVAPVSTLSATPPLSAIVADICTRSGLLTSDIDTSLLDVGTGSPATPVPAPGGYVISRPTTGQGALKPLTEAFFFDAVESGGVIKFVPRGGAAVTSITIPETDLGLVKDSFKLTEQLQMAQELPREVQVLFQDKNLDYQQNKTHKRRATRIVKTKNQTVFELAMVLDPSTARQISEKALFLAYLERHPYDFNLWRPLYMLFDPTDVIKFTYQGLNFVARILKADIGVDFSSQISLVSENANAYQSVIQGSSGTGVTPAAAKVLPDSTLFLFDIPLMQDSDSSAGGPGIYVGMGSLSPLTWPGASLQKSSDNVNFAQEDTSGSAIHYGSATTILPPPPSRGIGGVSPWVWDTVSTLTVVMQNGILTGTADLNVLNGQNALLVGSPTTGWELIQYANCVQNVDGSFTISRFLRGRRGTESQCALHVAGESVIDVGAAGIIRQPETTASLQVLRYFNPVTFGNILDPTQSQQFTEKGLDLFPYAVTSVAGARDQSGNLTASWIRRTRIGGDWLNGIGAVAVSETTESYDIDILTGPSGTVVRTFSALASPTLAYSAAQQTTDFGGPQAAISMNIYQNSGVTGRGFVKSVTV